MTLLERFMENWHKHRFAQQEDTVLLAVSGGSDSMAMLQLFREAGLYFAIAHCNFQLRGEESDKDEAIVRQLAFDINVPFHNVRFETSKVMDDWKRGVQETARILRYEWFEKIRLENKYACIATAHNANDNVETVLMNLFKGTGIAGMHGIQIKNNKIIRPMLFAAKDDILGYVKANDISFREDASNASDNYLRNAVRHNIIPVVKSLFKDVVHQVNITSERIGDAEVFYNRALEQERKKLIEKRGNDYYVSVLKLINREALGTLCFELFKVFGFTSAQTQRVIDLLTAESGHYISSTTHKIIRNRDFLIVTPLTSIEADFLQIDAVPCVIHTANHKYYFKEESKPLVISSDDSMALIDSAKLKYPLILRTWRMGDYFYPLGMGMKKKKLSKYFIDCKIPIHEKEKVWVLESDKHIVWVTGMRLDERFKVTDKTTRILKIEMRPR